MNRLDKKKQHIAFVELFRTQINDRRCWEFIDSLGVTTRKKWNSEDSLRWEDVEIYFLSKQSYSSSSTFYRVKKREKSTKGRMESWPLHHSKGEDWTQIALDFNTTGAET